jgi:phosphoesterase RecJ-like protein
LLTTHERTDGDDFGSIQALALHLKNLGKQVTIAVKGGLPDYLHFLAPKTQVLAEWPQETFDVLVTSGCSTAKRIGWDIAGKTPATVINFDHHHDSSPFGTINVIDASKSSVAELMYEFFSYCNWPFSPAIADCLLAGLMSDTGSFLFNNTQASTLKVAAELMTYGTHPGTISRHLFKHKTINHLKAWGRALDNAHLDTTKGMVHSAVTNDDWENLPEANNATFEGFVEVLNKAHEGKFAMFLKQDGQKIKGSLRSEEHKGINVHAIAKSLGGGGHILAAGFAMDGTLKRAEDGSWDVL